MTVKRSNGNNLYLYGYGLSDQYDNAHAIAVFDDNFIPVNADNPADFETDLSEFDT